MERIWFAILPLSKALQTRWRKHCSRFQTKDLVGQKLYGSQQYPFSPLAYIRAKKKEIEENAAQRTILAVIQFGGWLEEKTITDTNGNQTSTKVLKLPSGTFEVLTKLHYSFQPHLTPPLSTSCSLKLFQNLQRFSHFLVVTTLLAFFRRVG